MKNKKILSVTLLTLMCCFAGCKSFRYQEGKTFEECRRDLSECRSEMQNYFDKGYHLGIYDMKFEKSCMEEKGYRLVTEDKLPMRVKRQDPESTPARIIHGIAGTLEHE